MRETEIIYLSTEQKEKLTKIGDILGRSVYDLASCSIDEAILNFERDNGELR